MLAEALASWLDALTERELDAPMRALLLARGYRNVEFVHGSSEFGRDLIGQREDGDGCAWQWHLQSKAGNINKARWQEVRDQLEDIRTTKLRHPSINPALPTRAVVVTTGRLVGDARAGAAEYIEKYASEMPVEVWTRDRLIEYFVAAPDAVFAGAATGPLLTILGKIESGAVDDRELELFSRRWIPPHGEDITPAAQIEAAMVASRLAENDRLDLACLAPLALLRAAAAASHGAEPIGPVARGTIETAGRMFATHAEQLWERCTEHELDPIKFVNTHADEAGIFATYNVRCSRVIELLGLLGLWRERQGLDAMPIATWLTQFVARQPGAAHPLSDRWATSLIAPALLLGPIDPDVVTEWLKGTVRWLGDRLEHEGLGLADVSASPQDEIEYLFGSLEHINHRRRRESRTAAVVLDLATVLELVELYDVARHDFNTVGAAPDLLHSPDTVAQYLLDGEALERELSPPYLERWQDRDGWITAPHQREPASTWWLPRLGLYWEQLAVWSVLRDRHEASIMRAAISTAQA